MSNVDIVKPGQAAWCRGDIQAVAALVADDFAVTGVGDMPLGKRAFLGHCATQDQSFNARDWREEGARSM